jgi:hypothetical protein
MSMADVDPDLVEDFKATTFGKPVEGKPLQVRYDDLLEREIAASNGAYQMGGAR